MASAKSYARPGFFPSAVTKIELFFPRAIPRLMWSILVTAEGKKPGRAYDLAEAIRKRAGFEAKVCVLGHIQRGGAPTARDRILASRLGAYAVEKLIEGVSDIMVGLQAEKLVTHKLASVIGKKKQIPNELIKLAQILSA